MPVYLDIKLLYPHLKVNWNMLMCRICIVRCLVVNIFPWCNANFVPFPIGTLVARWMRNGRIRAPCREKKLCQFLNLGSKSCVICITDVMNFSVMAGFCKCAVYQTCYSTWVIQTPRTVHQDLQNQHLSIWTVVLIQVCRQGTRQHHSQTL